MKGRPAARPEGTRRHTATHGVNIANFALGRDAHGALGVVNVDESGASRVDQKVIDALSAIPAIRDARLIRV